MGVSTFAVLLAYELTTQIVVGWTKPARMWSSWRSAGESGLQSAGNVFDKSVSE